MFSSSTAVKDKGPFFILSPLFVPLCDAWRLITDTQEADGLKNYQANDNLIADAKAGNAGSLSSGQEREPEEA